MFPAALWRFPVGSVLEEGSRKVNMNRFLASCFALALLVQASLIAQKNGAPAPAESNAATPQLTEMQAGTVAATVGHILERYHFRQTKFDDTVSAGFLTNYLNTLDYNHMIFLQSDVDDFKAKYGTKLDDATKNGQVSPAFSIYRTYLDRLSERNILVQKLLKQEFDFNEDDNFILARNKESWPKD